MFLTDVQVGLLKILFLFAFLYLCDEYQWQKWEKGIPAPAAPTAKPPAQSQQTAPQAAPKPGPPQLCLSGQLPAAQRGRGAGGHTGGHHRDGRGNRGGQAGRGNRGANNGPGGGQFRHWDRWWKHDWFGRKYPVNVFLNDFMKANEKKLALMVPSLSFIG